MGEYAQYHLEETLDEWLDESYWPYEREEDDGDGRIADLAAERLTRDTFLWHTKDGQSLSLGQITDAHLGHIITFLETKPEWNETRLALLRTELTQRKSRPTPSPPAPSSRKPPRTRTYPRPPIPPRST